MHGIQKLLLKTKEQIIVIEDTKKREVLTRQIAGALAKRIIYYSKEQQNATQGEELGFIKFGSRVDLYLPIGA